MPTLNLSPNTRKQNQDYNSRPLNLSQGDRTYYLLPHSKDRRPSPSPMVWEGAESRRWILPEALPALQEGTEAASFLIP